MKLTALALLLAFSVTPASRAASLQQCAGCVAKVTDGSDPVISPPPPGCSFSTTISVTLQGHPESCTGAEGECQGDPCSGSWSYAWAASCPVQFCTLTRGITTVSGVLLCNTIQPGASSDASTGTIACGRDATFQMWMKSGTTVYAHDKKTIDCSPCK